MSLKQFSKLIHLLAAEINEQLLLGHLKDYFRQCPDGEEKDLSLQLLLNLYPPKLIQAKQLTNWTAELTRYPAWLIERSEQEVGHPVRTLALLIREGKNHNSKMFTLVDLMNRISAIRNLDEASLKRFVMEDLGSLNPDERLFALKLLTGTFKSPVSEQTVIEALSIVLQINIRTLSLRLFLLKEAKRLSFDGLALPISNEAAFIPEDFPKTIEIKGPSEFLGDISNWMAFGKRPGIQVQLIKHGNTAHLWSEHFEIVTNKFPEVIQKWSQFENDIQIFGQLIPADASDQIELLANRMKKKTISSSDIRNCQAEIEIWHYEKMNDFSVAGSYEIGISPVDKIVLSSWQQLEEFHGNCREKGFTGIALMQKDEFDHLYYWKASSHSIRAVLIYVEFGSMAASGIRSLTFGLKQGHEFVPVAKVEKLPEELVLNEILAFMRENTLERFGPVRTISPNLLFELYFDEISHSSRHKCGFKLTKVRLGIKINESVENASSLKDLESLLYRSGN